MNFDYFILAAPTVAQGSHYKSITSVFQTIVKSLSNQENTS